jgi:hypothetical protein
VVFFLFEAGDMVRAYGIGFFEREGLIASLPVLDGFLLCSNCRQCLPHFLLAFGRPMILSLEGRT